ncbi:MAG: hypothetical protein Kow0079_07960 [Vicingaceae bacterium]|jgi:hypothetical protein
MIKDIKPPKVEGIALTVIREFNELGAEEWNVYIINMKPEKIEGVLVSSKGYGQNVKGEELTTSTLRHFIGDVAPNSYAKIEPIMEEVFGLHNEYWVSFFIDGVMYDKKYIFLAETINENNFTKVPVIDKKGVLIK